MGKVIDMRPYHEQREQKRVAREKLERRLRDLSGMGTTQMVTPRHQMKLSDLKRMKPDAKPADKYGVEYFRAFLDLTDKEPVDADPKS